jgi:uncharacterized protein
MRALVIVLGVLAGLYVLLMVAAWAWQERIVWQPPMMDVPGADSGAVRVDYSAEDGQRLFAYVVGDLRTARGVLIAFHGNAEVAAWSVGWARETVRRTGWAVVLPEYRGYGGLSGPPTYKGSILDARAAWRTTQERVGDAQKPVALYGHSLGTAVASELASEQPPAVLLLVSPFTSARDMARGMGGRPLSALWPLIGRVAFDTRAKVAGLDAPVFVAHGGRDRVIPVRMGREVHAAARRKGELLIIPAAGHNDILLVAPADYWRWLTNALATAL